MIKTFWQTNWERGLQGGIIGVCLLRAEFLMHISEDGKEYPLWPKTTPELLLTIKPILHPRLGRLWKLNEHVVYKDLEKVKRAAELLARLKG